MYGLELSSIFTKMNYKPLCYLVVKELLFFKDC